MPGSSRPGLLIVVASAMLVAAVSPHSLCYTSAFLPYERFFFFGVYGPRFLAVRLPRCFFGFFYVFEIVNAG